MRHSYLVAYDVSDPKRLKRTYKKMFGFGKPLQYSVFRCELSDIELTLMKAALAAIINHVEDRVLIADIGPVDGRAGGAFEFMGRGLAPVPETQAFIV